MYVGLGIGPISPGHDGIVLKFRLFTPFDSQKYLRFYESSLGFKVYIRPLKNRHERTWWYCSINWVWVYIFFFCLFINLCTFCRFFLNYDFGDFTFYVSNIVCLHFFYLDLFGLFNFHIPLVLFNHFLNLYEFIVQNENVSNYTGWHEQSRRTGIKFLSAGYRRIYLNEVEPHCSYHRPQI